VGSLNTQTTQRRGEKGGDTFFKWEVWCCENTIARSGCQTKSISDRVAWRNGRSFASFLLSCFLCAARPLRLYADGRHLLLLLLAPGHPSQRILPATDATELHAPAACQKDAQRRSHHPHDTGTVSPAITHGILQSQPYRLCSNSSKQSSRSS